MSIYTYNITNATGDEQLIIGRPNQVTKVTLITVNKESGDFSFSLVLTRLGVETPLYSQDLKEGESLIDTNGYFIDNSSILTMSATTGVNVAIIGDTSPENAVNPVPIPDNS